MIDFNLVDLVWRQDYPVSGEDIENPEHDAARLSSGQVGSLRDLAQRGYVKGLRELLDRFGREQPELLPALRPLQDLVAQYRLDAVQQALDEAGA